MAATLEELEKRMARMEQEMERLRQLVEQPPDEEQFFGRGIPILEKARREKPRLRALVAKVFEEMGIRGEPVPPEQLRARMEAEGIRPEDNLFSRGIIEMREE